jgi:hypothetical protein
MILYAQDGLAITPLALLSQDAAHSITVDGTRMILCGSAKFLDIIIASARARVLAQIKQEFASEREIIARRRAEALQ